MPMFPVLVFGVSFCGSYCPNVIVFLVFVGRTVLMLLYFQLVGAPGAVNIHYFAWKLLGAIYKFSFMHSFYGMVEWLLPAMFSELLFNATATWSALCDLVKTDFNS